MSKTTNDLLNINFMSENRFKDPSTTFSRDEIYAVEATESSLTPTMPLLTPIWEDHLLNDACYLRGDTFSWQSGDIYKAAYNHLADDLSDIPEVRNQHIEYTLNNGTLTIKAGSVYCTPNGLDSSEKPLFTNTTINSDIVLTNLWGTYEDVVVFIDYNGNISKHGKTRFSKGPTAPTATNAQAWYDTTTNTIRQYSGGEYKGTGASLPFLIGHNGTGDTPTIESVYQVFNSINWFDHKNETIGGVSIEYFETKDEHKICLPYQEQQIIDAYNTSGNAWYYIVDTINNRFKLPRSTHGDLIDAKVDGTSGYRVYSDGWCEQWGQTSAVSGSQTIQLYKPYRYSSYGVQVTCVDKANSDQNWTAMSRTLTSFVITDSEAFAHCWYTFGYTSNYVVNNQQKHLYFYVGNHIRNELNVDVGYITEELNTKVDKSNLTEGNIVVESYKNGNTWYRVWSDGWIEQGTTATVPNSGTATWTFPKAFTDTTYTVTYAQTGDATSYNNSMRIIKTSNTQITLGNNNGGSTNTYYAYACGY